MGNGLDTTVFGAVIAALGFVGKQLYDLLRSVCATRRSRRARLLEMMSLLKAGRAVFIIQNEHATELLNLVRHNHPGAVPPEAGYERAFSTVFSKLTPEEKERHALIRGQTMSALRPVNDALVHWLAQDDYYKTFVSNPFALRRESRARLASLLAKLDVHLRLWKAKYEIWIPDHPEHALVYMADEEQHGLGFPHGLDALVEELAGIAPAAQPSP